MRALIIALLLTLCVATSPAKADETGLHAVAATLGRGEYHWGDDRFGAEQVAVVISVALQRAYVYRGDSLIGVARVSTGRRGKATPLGSFTVLQKAVRHQSNLYSNAPMPFMQRLTWDGIALHAGYDPGQPASHGCVRLPLPFARALYALTALGTPVTVADYPIDNPVILAVMPFFADAPAVDGAPLRLDYVWTIE